MSRRQELVHLLVAAVLGLGAALVVDHRLDTGPEREYGDPAGDRVLEAVEGLRDDHVHVTDDGRKHLDQEGELVVAAAIAERDLPAYVLVWEQSWFAGYDHWIQAAEQVLHHLTEPAVLVLWQGPDASTTQVTPGYQVIQGEDYTDRPEPEPSYLGEAALRLPEWLAQLPDGAVEPSGNDDWGEPTDGFWTGLVLGLLVMGAAWVLVGVVRLSTGRRFRNLPR